MAEQEKNAFIDRLKKRLDSFTYPEFDEDQYNQKYFEQVGLTNVELRSYQLHGVRWLMERYDAEHGASKTKIKSNRSISISECSFK
jgi:hypothetical protein